MGPVKLLNPRSNRMRLVRLPSLGGILAGQRPCREFDLGHARRSPCDGYTLEVSDVGAGLPGAEGAGGRAESMLPWRPAGSPCRTPGRGTGRWGTGRGDLRYRLDGVEHAVQRWGLSSSLGGSSRRRLTTTNDRKATPNWASPPSQIQRLRIASSFQFHSDRTYTPAGATHQWPSPRGAHVDNPTTTRGGGTPQPQRQRAGRDPRPATGHIDPEPRHRVYPLPAAGIVLARLDRRRSVIGGAHFCGGPAGPSGSSLE